MRPAVSRAIGLLASRRTAVVMLVAMTAVLLLASLVPDRGVLQARELEALRARRPVAAFVGEHLRPQAVTASPVFLAFPAYLFVAVGASVVERLRIRRRVRDRWRAGRLERFRVSATAVVPGASAACAARLRRELARQGYSVQDGEAGSVVGTRGEWGFRGSIAFHVALLVVLAGVAVSSRTRVNGEILLVDGYPAPLEPASFVALSGRERMPALSGVSLRMRDFTAEYSPSGTPVDFAAVLGIEQQGRTLDEAVVRVNDGLTWGGFQLTLFRYGFAPTLEVRDASGALLYDAIGVLQLLPAGREDAIALSDGGEVRLRLYPDFALTAGEPSTRSLLPRSPVLAVTARSGSGAILGDGRVALGAEETVGGLKVRFASLSYWAGFMVARDLGVWLLAAGSALGALGLALRFGFPDQTLQARVQAFSEGTRVELTASTRFFPALHEERIRALVGRLEESP